MKRSDPTHVNGLGLGTVLFMVFLVLKLTDHIDWSWWWVSSPLWIPVALIGVFFLIGGIGAAVSRDR